MSAESETQNRTDPVEDMKQLFENTPLLNEVFFPSEPEESKHALLSSYNLEGDLDQFFNEFAEFKLEILGAIKDLEEARQAETELLQMLVVVEGRLENAEEELARFSEEPGARPHRSLALFLSEIMLEILSGTPDVRLRPRLKHFLWQFRNDCERVQDEAKLRRLARGAIECMGWNMDSWERERQS